ncbi:MAG: TerB family tellurite resistance protein [Alphaproteobacteria bacterium]|nr:TerB family tellurite resistance protein [Alphaproteobacteria bacterium]
MSQIQSADYISQMTEQDKIIFLQFLVMLAKIDNHFDEVEKEFITATADNLHISSDKLGAILQTDSADEVIHQASLITNRFVALNIIKEACFLANSDDDLSAEEVTFIGRFGEAMGVEPQTVEAISQWVIDYLIWQEQGKIIFEQN